MTTGDDAFRRLSERLAPAGQAHVLAFWNELTDRQRQTLARQVDEVDLALVASLYAQRDAADNYRELAARAEPPPAFRLGQEDPRVGVAAARELGLAALSAGEVGAVLVAGGQGSRLGFEHPKGMFPIGPVSGHTLFQILFEKLLATSRRAGARIPLYVMTSSATHEETATYLADNGNFGLPPEDVTLFRQGNLPAVDAASGKLLLESRDSLALSPDGHGGMVAALSRSGALDDMRRRGLKRLFYFQVDNPLAVMCDPVFLGYHLASGSELSTQVVAKAAPLERVGNVVAVDGQVRIIEYSDLAEEFARATNPDGSLRLWAGNIAVHVFDVEFLARMATAADASPYHVARKAVAGLDERGQPVAVDEKVMNAIKFERFIFDLLPAAERAIVMEVDAAECFAPVKNSDAESKDTPASVRRQMIALHRKWLEAAGARVAEDAIVEIRPTFALDAEDVAKRLTKPIQISAPTFLK